jgi:hypothetical protein
LDAIAGTKNEKGVYQEGALDKAEAFLKDTFGINDISQIEA